MVSFSGLTCQESGVAKILSAATTEEILAIQKHADLVAVAEIKFFQLVASESMLVRDTHLRSALGSRRWKSRSQTRPSVRASR